MRICREKTSGYIVEMQTRPTPGTLLSNRVSDGQNPDEYEEVEMSRADYDALMVVQDASEDDEELAAKMLLRESAHAKLAALGLTEAEIKAL